MGNALILLFHSEKNWGNILKERKDVVKIITGYVLPGHIQKFFFFEEWLP
jgi:hypothetical protein